jgi:diguanylate cyclase
MVQMLESILANVALLFIMHLVFLKLQSKTGTIPQWKINIMQVFIITFTSASMIFFPISFGEYRFDFRILPLMLFILGHGWKLGSIAMLLVSCVRLLIGGEAAALGAIFGIILPGLIVFFFANGTISKTETKTFFLISSLVIFVSDVPIIFVLPNGMEIFKTIFLLRYISFLLASYFILLLIRDSQKTLKLQQRLKFYADHDPLTGLFNNRRFFEEIKQTNKVNPPYFIAMLDIDHFKNVNDTYGHITGDKLLKEVAKILLDDEEDIVVGRYGGEEFILLLHNRTPIEALNTLDKLRVSIERNKFLSTNNQIIPLTVSIGFSSLLDFHNMKKTIDVADQELYKAKRLGRNCISTDLL